MAEPIVDRDFAEKFLTAVDRPFDYGVYFLFHDWWAEAPQEAIDQYSTSLHQLPGIKRMLDARYLAEPLSLTDLETCRPGTLGHSYRTFIVESGLEANLGRNYRKFNEELHASGTLDRLPDDISYVMVRGFQIHDFLHVMTGFSSKPLGELAQAGFHFAQMRMPYHAFRTAVTTAHMAFVNPKITGRAMDALVAGWTMGNSCDNLHLEQWEDHLHDDLDELRAKASLDLSRFDSF